VAKFKCLGNTTIRTKTSSAEDYNNTGQILAMPGIFSVSSLPAIQNIRICLNIFIVLYFLLEFNPRVFNGIAICSKK